MTEPREEVVFLSEEARKKCTSLFSYSNGFLETIDKQYEEYFEGTPAVSAPGSPRVLNVYSVGEAPYERERMLKYGYVYNAPGDLWILAEGYNGYTLAWGTYDLSTNAMLPRQDEIPPKGHVHAKWVEVCRRVIREDFERQAKLSKEKIAIWTSPSQYWFPVGLAKGEDETAVVLAPQLATPPSIRTTNSPAVVAQAKPCSAAPALAMHSWPPKGAQRLGLFLPK